MIAKLKKHPFISLLILIFVTGLLAGLSLRFGSQALPWYWQNGVWHPVIYLRFWRTLAALSIGGALAISGLTFQALLRNALAEPFTLGVSGGAGVGAAVAFIAGWQLMSAYAVPLAAFGGAVMVLFAVLWLNRQGNFSGEGLLLSGVIAGTIASGLLTYLVSNTDQETLAGVTWFLLGDLQAPDPQLALTMLLVLLAGLAGLQFCANDLNALSLGDETAFHLGINVRRVGLWLTLLAALLSACSVALAGIVSFVGLIVPHIVRKIWGGNHRYLVLLSAVCGGGFLVGCDLLSRSLPLDKEMPIGVVTALVGGPIFLYLLTVKRTK